MATNDPNLSISKVAREQCINGDLSFISEGTSLILDFRDVGYQAANLGFKSVHVYILSRSRKYLKAKPPVEV